ncbi:hypothetical protein D3C85_1435180 [compost metagenome]
MRRTFLQFVQVGQVDVEAHFVRTVEGPAEGSRKLAGRLDPAFVKLQLGLLVGVVGAGKELAPDILDAVQHQLGQLPRIPRRADGRGHLDCGGGRGGVCGDVLRERRLSGFQAVYQTRRAKGQVERHATQRHDDQHPGQPP